MTRSQKLIRLPLLIIITIAVKMTTFVDAVHREDIKKLARETSKDGMFVLDELPEEDEDVIINPDFIYEG